MQFTIPPRTTAVMGIPIGKLNDLNNRVAQLENASSSIGSEVSTTVPNSSTQVFNFTHKVGIIHWNGQQIFSIGSSPSYTLTGTNQITFTGTLTPQTGDDVINTF